MPNIAPDASPINALRAKTEATRLRHVTAVCATEISITPKTLIRMAKNVPGVILSPKKTRANSAACAGSVRE